MAYVHGASKQAAQAVRETADQVKARLDHLRRTDEAIKAEQAAKDAELARIRAARKRLEPKATYKPTPEQLVYRDEHGHAIAKQPNIHGGRHGLAMASREAAGYWTEHHPKEGVKRGRPGGQGPALLGEARR